MSEVKITKAMQRTLQFVGDHEPVSLFPATAPLFMIRRARDSGFVTSCGANAMLTAYRLTQAGQEALARATGAQP